VSSVVSFVSDIDDTPVNGELAAPISSNWAFDHVAAADPHTGYALLAGRSGGQVLKGGTASGDDLTLQSTNNATRGHVFFGSAQTSGFDEVNGRLGIGTASPLSVLHAESSANIRAVIRNTTESTGYSSSLDFLTGTGSFTSLNTVARIEAAITQADPSALKGDLVVWTNAGDVSAERARFSSTGMTLATDLAITEGGTGQSTATNAFDALAPTTTQGDISYHDGTDNVRLAKGAAGTVLVMNATIPTWDASFLAFYHTILDVSGSHIAGRTAAAYGFGQGHPLAISGTGTLYPLKVIHIVAADYPTIGTLAAKLRIRAQVYVNDTAPTGTYIVALHPLTTPATSGAAGLRIYTIGAAVASSAATTVNAPAADSETFVVGSDFALPTDGDYVIGMTQTGTVAASSHMHFSAQLQVHNN
jgi:hypothetical protein